MVYECLVLMALSNLGNATPEQITKWLKNNWFFFANGNRTRVALNRLQHKNLVARDGSVYFVTSQGKEFCEQNKQNVFNGALSKAEMEVLELLKDEAQRWGSIGCYELHRLAKHLNMPYKTCLDACVRLACKAKVYLFKRRKGYYVGLCFSEIESLGLGLEGMHNG